MFNNLDRVEITHNIDKFNLKEGDRGTIVEIYNNGVAYEVEFVNSNGNTKALLTLEPSDIRCIGNRDFANLYELAHSIKNYSSSFARTLSTEVKVHIHKNPVSNTSK